MRRTAAWRSRAAAPSTSTHLDPDRHLGLLAVAAERLGLDRQALEAAARAALSAPDRVVTVDVAAGVAA